MVPEKVKCSLTRASVVQSSTQIRGESDMEHSHHHFCNSSDLLDSDICSSEHERSRHDIRNAVLVSANILQEAGKELLPQYGLLGTFSYESAEPSHIQADERIFLNTNIPFSAFICGVQGSGKSHTTSCLLGKTHQASPLLWLIASENSLIRSEMLGSLPNPLSALVFHFSEFSSRTSYNPCEAAFLAMAHPKFPSHSTAAYLTVVVPPSNHYNLRQIYARFPKVEVLPFKLKPQILDVGTMLVLMAVDQTKDRSLYMAQVIKVLREVVTHLNGDFDYHDFRSRLSKQKFDRQQNDFLNQRLDLLESFLDLDGESAEPRFRPGEITIMDMSCPFVDSNTACVLFKIALRKYLESHANGKLIVLDEAHKVCMP